MSRAHLAREVDETNAAAAAVYYSTGALDPEATSSDVSHLRAPVLIIAGEYDVGLPPKRGSARLGRDRRKEQSIE